MVNDTKVVLKPIDYYWVNKFLTTTSC